MNQALGLVVFVCGVVFGLALPNTARLLRICTGRTKLRRVLVVDDGIRCEAISCHKSSNGEPLPVLWIRHHMIRNMLAETPLDLSCASWRVFDIETPVPRIKSTPAVKP